jgi:DNA-binding NtrC family response regulator
MNTGVSQSAPPLSELLVADADPTSVELCRQLTGASGLTVRRTHDSETTLDGLESGLVDVLLLSEQLPGGSDLEFLRHIRYWYPETQVIMISDRPSYTSAVQATKLGAFDYMPKPLESQLLQTTIERAIEHDRMGRTALRERIDGEAVYGIVGKTPVIWKLYKVIEKVSANIHPVLIMGESGTGKELVAQAIHFSGVRRERPFIPVDCGTLVPTLNGKRTVWA